MKLITFATCEEADASLAQFDAKKVKPGMYESSIGYFAITGIGPFAAFHTLQSLQCDEIINIGLAGSLREDLQLGSIHAVASCTKHIWHPRGKEAAKECLAASCKKLFLNTEGLRLMTVDFPLHEKDSVLHDSDLIDMEGYSIALQALLNQKPCRLYKLVSDYCNSATPSQIKSNLPQYSKSIALFLNNLSLTF